MNAAIGFAGVCIGIGAMAMLILFGLAAVAWAEQQ